jgi:hypothetical protein
VRQEDFVNKLPKDVLDIIKASTFDAVSRRRTPSSKYIYHEVVIRILLLNELRAPDTHFLIPSRSTVQRKIKELAAHNLVQLRHRPTRMEKGGLRWPTEDFAQDSI